MKRNIRKHFNTLINPFISLPDTPIIILGHQKSGTSAISRLFAERSGKTLTLDTPLLWEPHLGRLIKNRSEFKYWVTKHKRTFSKDIIKEPNLTYFYDEICHTYKSPKFIYVVRDPRSNIRSLLNRLKLKGNHSVNPDLSKVEDAWKPLFESSYEKDIHYVKAISERWISFVDCYLQNKDNMHLIKYENFVQDKQKCIDELCELFDFPKVSDITELLDVQFQPRGDRNISYQEFFGDNNLEKIETTCSDLMIKLGYR